MCAQPFSAAQRTRERERENERRSVESCSFVVRRKKRIMKDFLLTTFSLTFCLARPLEDTSVRIRVGSFYVLFTLLKLKKGVL